MTHAERECAQGKAAGGVSDGQHDQPELSGGPRHVGLQAVGQLGAVASFVFAAFEPSGGDASVAVKFAA
jgi:hypothetical protein